MSLSVPLQTRPSEVLFGRFEVLETLGVGGFGRVVRALDRETGGLVAVKELHRCSAESVMQLKREFRSLSDVHHPALVRLGELFESAGRWGFSMELVAGTDFLSWVRDPAAALGFDESRLRGSSLQLARGLVGLHRLGYLHRDVKPQNVSVTPEGRVVLLDFGLVTHLGAVRRVPETATGTVAYMAPEQASDVDIDGAADFYAFGVLLYEALTGQVPFDGSPEQVIFAKQRRRPRAPRELMPGVPSDLEGLCTALLAIDPRDRPSGDDVVRALGGAGPGATSVSMPPVAVQATEELFVGRERELAMLEDWLLRSRTSQFELVLVEGESGVGKSALVRRFAASLVRRQPGSVRLEGRCHAAEQVPFKMFDGVMDELTHFLRALEPAVRASFLPPDSELISVLFPVFEQVLSGARAARRGAAVERFAVFRVLSELLRRVGEGAPLLLVVDDLQWGDAESVQLLRSLLDAPAGARALCVATVRTLEGLEGPLAEELRGLVGHARVHRLRLEPLDQAEATALGAQLLGVSIDDPRVAELVGDAGGHPLFISELTARGVHGPHATAPGGGRGERRSLDEALFERATQVDALSRGMLELLAVAGAPTSLGALSRALHADSEQVAGAAMQLRAGRLARAVRRGELACYHDRVREALLARMDDAARARAHRQLAHVCLQARERDAAEIARHLLAAGEVARARPWLERAAEEASGKAAFEKAVDLYRTLLGGCAADAGPDPQYRWQLALSEALASAGRCAESARVLLEARATAPQAERHRLHVRAAQRLLQAGEVADGLSAAELALGEVGLAWPRSTATAVGRLLFHRLGLKLRGLGVRLRPEVEVEDALRAQLDTLWRLWQPLLWADMLRSAELSARHFSLALRAGSARHVALARSGEAVVVAAQHADRDRCARLLAPMSGQPKSPELLAYQLFARGYVRFLLWEVAPAAQDLAEAERMYRQDCPSDPWMLANVRGALLAAWYNLGDQRRAVVEAERWIAEAEARGDRFAFASCSVLGLGALRHLMCDEPERALVEVRRAMAPFSSGSIGGQHLGELSVCGAVQMYLGGAAAYAYWREIWPRFSSSFLARARFARELFDWCRADAALRAGLAAAEPARRDLIEEARGILAAIPRRDAAVIGSLIALLEAQLLLVGGEPARAAQAARRAHERFEQVGHYQRWGSGLLLAHLEGAQAYARGRAAWVSWLREQGWQAPDRALQMGLAIFPWLEAAQAE